ncbi:MAG: glycosyltransferase family 2 protein [Clostridia bacterium]|nr:glycosyltransferase family 2 protein [Clostridia bacterium]
MKEPCLYIIVPCYNEQTVLPQTLPMFVNKLRELISSGAVSASSRAVFVNDGSKDKTWDIIKEYAKNESVVEGISLSRNRGHQNALLCGLMTVKDRCDITISIDCDGQDDINAMNEMIEVYKNGAEIVYGVRKSRKTDTFFKRFTAQTFYKLLNAMGAEVVYDHADYRLISSKVLNEFADFKEVNIFLRGMVPLVGFNSAEVYYERHERIAGESHYSLKKMLSLATDGITSLSVKPIRLITSVGLILFLSGLCALIVCLIVRLCGGAVSDVLVIVSALGLLSGLQTTALGVVGEYVGKIYLETKARPRYIVSETTFKDGENA